MNEIGSSRSSTSSRSSRTPSRSSSVSTSDREQQRPRSRSRSPRSRLANMNEPRRIIYAYMQSVQEDFGPIVQTGYDLFQRARRLCSRISFTYGVSNRVSHDDDDEDDDDVDDDDPAAPAAAAADNPDPQVDTSGLSSGEIAAATRSLTYSSMMGNPDDPESTTCSLCLDRFADNDQLRVLPCLHRFHARCIDPWLKKKAICPVCRTSVRSEEADD